MNGLSLDALEIVHERILEIGKAFHDVLEKHSIPYYMLGGTMLGAVRHKGIIPWDDDMDFGIPREFYDKALTILERELPSQYRVLRSTSGEAVYDCSKIEDISTEIVEEGWDGKKRGMFIDIFPLDYGNDKWGITSRNWWIRNLMCLNIFKTRTPKSFNLQMVAMFVKLFPRNFFLKIARKMLVSKGDFIINYGGFWGAKEIVGKSIFGSPTLYSVGRYKFFGVECPDKYLSKLYGNYMELPPVEKRHSHIISYKIN